MTDQTGSGLDPIKRAALLAKLRERGTESPRQGATPTITRVSRDGPLPLSWAQQRLWFLDQLDAAAGAAYHMFASFRLRGTLDRVALKAALDRVVQRHESLRTTFTVVADEPVQTIGPVDTEFALSEVDLSGANNEGLEERLAAHCAEQARRPFDLARGPLARGQLLRLADDDNLLLIAKHHIISDGWSVGLLMQEVSELYSAFSRGAPDPMPPLRAQYADYAAWERRWLTAERLHRQTTYWRQQLHGAPAFLDMPTDRPRPLAQSYSGASVNAALAPELVVKLRVLSQRHQTTLFMTLLAAWGVLLSRLSGQQDIVVATAIANRGHTDVEPIIGFFVNTLALRLRLDGDLTVAELLTQVKSTTLGAYENQELPFDQVVEALQPARSLSHSPIANVMLGLRNTPQGRHPVLQGVALEQVEIPITTTHVDLSMNLIENGDAVTGTLDYASDLFDATTIERLSSNWRTLLEALAQAAPNDRVGKLRLMSEAQQYEVVEVFNNTTRPVPQDALLHGLFETHAATDGDAVALFHEGESLSYRVLNETANRIAHRLLGLGVKPDQRVAVCVPRGPVMIAAMLGVLKAGGAFVPMDVAYPMERLDLILSDSRPTVLLTQAGSTDDLFTSQSLVQLPLAASLPEILPQEASHNPVSATLGLAPSHVAYVTFTSGSTGKPKGVLNPHRGICNLIQECIREYNVVPTSRLLQFASCAFDSFVWEVGVALGAGASLYLAAKADLHPGEPLARALSTGGITHAMLPPSVLAAISPEGPYPTLHTVITGSEVVPPAVVKAWSRHRAVFASYGPTECATFVTNYACAALQRLTVPIGRPLGNSRIYLLDPQGQPVPIGTPGEIHIGGVQVSNGYLDRPELTAERFVANPFHGGRMYRTGDMGRWLPDGNVEFLGRNDFQVKLRGFRVEPGEIEARLSHHPEVRESVVVMRQDTAGDKRLVCYVIPRRDESVSDEAFERQHVSEWNQLFSDSYQSDLVAWEAGFKHVGWNSSYTKQPIVESEMREWLDTTLQRVRGLAPRRVLEVGCGTGMVLFNIAPHCEAYDAIEIGRGIVTRLNDSLTRTPALAGRTRVFHGHATDLSSVPADVHYDTVVMNSVVAYFPSLDYLREAIGVALSRISGEGHLFIGDVRNHALLEEFHLTVQLFQADAELSAEQLLAKVYKRAAGEAELLVEPAWFLALPAQFPEITGVSLVPKETVFDNEMSTFRYDVVIEVRGQSKHATEVEWRMLSADDDLESLTARVEDANAPVVAFRGLRNPHQHAAEDVLDALRDRSYKGHAGGLRALLRERATGLSTGLIAQLCRARKWGMRLRFSVDIDLKGVLYDVAIFRDAAAAARWDWPQGQHAAMPAPARFANDPLRAKWSLGLPERLRTHLSESLPEYMVPGAFVTLPEFPRTPNGKLDRAALPAPDVSDVVVRRFEAPQPGLESEVAALWRELLGLQRVGRQDDFFELGGHSLRAAQFIARLNQSHGVQASLKELFATPVLHAFVASLQKADADVLPPVTRRGDVAPLPMSWTQQRLWFIAQLDEAASIAYHMAVGLALHGRLDLDALQRSLDRIVARQEILRTTFRELDGEAVQVIGSPDQGFLLKLHDLRTLDPLQQAQAIETHRAEEAREPFDLAAGPLARGRLLRLADDSHLLFLTQHHIISDGWSSGLLIQEVSTLYSAIVRGNADPLPVLEVQYADYALWQRRWLNAEYLRPQVDFWRAHLAGAPALLELPTDRPRPAVQSWKGRKSRISISAELASELRALSRSAGTTMFMTMLAGWVALMHRLSGQSDVVVGMVSANRKRVEIEPVMGFFVNTLALRVKIDGEEDVSSLLSKIKATTLNAYANQDVPFEQIVEAVQPIRSLSHGPLFQVMFAFENMPTRHQFDLPGLQLRSIETDHATTQFDLALSLSDSDGAVEGQLEYATDLFDASTIDRIIGQYTSLLRAFVLSQHDAIDRLPLLTASERQTLLVDFNDTATDAPPRGQSLVHQLFESQAAARPDAVAVVYERETVSYGELNRRANRIAHHLIAMGVKPDDCVAICLERSPDMVAGLLGILKAGAAYVPIEPTYPSERIAYMLADSSAVCIVAAEAFAGLMQAADVPVVFLDGPQATALEAQPGHDPDPASIGLTATHLAYVLYTSGSTGKPKGAMNQHDGVVNRIVWAQKQYVFAHDDRILQKTPFSFDVSAWEFFWTLGVGATLVVARPGGHQDLHYLADTVDERKITTIHFVSSMLPMFMELAEPGRFESLRRVIVGGEILSYAVQQRFEQCLPNVELHNQYGPTEAAIDVTYWRCRSDLHPGIVPIGRPIDNTQLFILDRHMEPVPIGVKGELFIGGIQVGRGYLNRPELTSERFIPDIFSRRPGARLYRSGDIARWLPDGSIDFAGRNDFQIKIRGFRIELGEIEARLAALEEVREAVVIAREDVPGDQRLAAYVVLQEGAVATPIELRDKLAVSLADYMVPSAYVFLPRLPLTPNGKLDRPALPVPQIGALAARAYVAPKEPMEIAIAELWSELLRTPNVSRFDSFFELGGHSLLAVQFVSRLRRDHGVELALRDVFANPTLERIAAHACTLVPTNAPASAIVRRPATAAIPLSFAQRRLWIMAQIEPAASAAYHMPAGLELRGRLDQVALQAALDRIVARHESLRTTFQARGESAVQIIAAEDAGFALAFHDLSSMAPAERRTQADAHGVDESSAPFDLERGPLIRGRLLRLADDHHLLFITQHHIISDGWSVGLLVAELSALYSAFVQGHADPLPALEIQYPDYAIWQRSAVSQERLQKQAAFWRDHLHGAPPLLQIPTDRPRPAVQSYVGSTVPFAMAPRLTEAIRGLAKRQGATTFMTMFAAWALLLSRVSGQQDVVIGTAVANRTQAETENIIGFFVSTLALRVRFDTEQTVDQLFAGVRDTTLRAFDNQDLPFEQVVEAVQPVRTMSYNPLFQANLILENVPTRRDLQLPGLLLSPAQSQQHGTQFDLALHLRESLDDGNLEGDFHYATDLFDRSTIERLSGHLLTLLEALATAEPGERCATLPILSDEQRAVVLERFSTAPALPIPDGLVHAHVEAQARQRGSKTALVHEDRTLTYEALNQRANQLAHRLIDTGVKPGDRVALCADRGFGMVVGMLGILKAGGAYVPLDPDYPPDRLQYMLGDSRPMAIVAELSAIRDLRTDALPVVMLDTDDAAATGASLARFPDPVVANLDSSSAAYVIYTSGSTGLPKGVEVAHRSVLNLWRGLDETALHGMTDDVVVAWNAAMSFDASVQAFVQLLSGRQVVLIPEAIRADAEALVSYMSRHGVEVFDCTPSQLKFVYQAELIAAGAFQPKVVMVGGEPISEELWQRLKATEGTRFVNLYGPTECTVDATFCEVRAGSGRPNIGRPMPNACVYILDPQGNPQPIGVVGEIFVGGAGVANGYLDREELTAQRFVSDPFSARVDARMYRTGDLALWRPDGNIDYIGRNDFQVKLRGFRIELGEIESVLRGCAGVLDAAAMVREDIPGDRRLVAYVRPLAGFTIEPALLRQALSQGLPEYMVPAAFVTVPEFPQTTSGKLDRAALPAPGQEALVTRPFEPPLGTTEVAITAIWASLLNVERVGRHDDFFELGGYSLTAIQVIARIRKTLDVTIPLGELFANPTVAGLAELIHAQQLSRFEDSEVDRLAAEIGEMSEEELRSMLDQ